MRISETPHYTWYQGGCQTKTCASQTTRLLKIG